MADVITTSLRPNHPPVTRRRWIIAVPIVSAVDHRFRHEVYVRQAVVTFATAGMCVHLFRELLTDHRIIGFGFGEHLSSRFAKRRLNYSRYSI